MNIKLELTSEQYDLLMSHIDDRIRNPHSEPKFEAILDAMKRGFEEWQPDRMKIFQCPYCDATEGFVPQGAMLATEDRNQENICKCECGHFFIIEIETITIIKKVSKIEDQTAWLFTEKQTNFLEHEGDYYDYPK